MGVLSTILPITATPMLRTTQLNKTQTSFKAHGYIANEILHSTAPSPDHDTSYSAPSMLTIVTNLTKRQFSIPTGKLMFHYSIYQAFIQSWRVSDLLYFFWTRLAIDAQAMGSSEFEKELLTFDVGGFKVDFVSQNGEMRRDFVVAVANAMMEHSTKGFLGLFNARVVISGVTFWVTMRVADG